MIENKEVSEYIDKLNKKDRFKAIFRWHNGLMLEDKLNLIEGFEEFKYDCNRLNGNLIFTNNSNEEIIVDELGTVIKGPEELKNTFEWFSKSRLNHTNKMLKRMSILKEGE